MTGENLGYKTGVAEKVKFENSPSGKVFNKGLDDIDCWRTFEKSNKYSNNLKKI